MSPMPTDRSTEKEQRWTIWLGSHGGPMITPIDSITREPIEVVPAGHPLLLSPEEARAIGELCAGAPTAEQEQLALRALGRLSNYTGEEKDSNAGS